MTGEVKNYIGGKPIVILGTDGVDLYGITVDPSGHLQVDALSSALPSGAATQATLADILAKLDVALSTRALEAGGNLASILARLDVALSTRALEAGGNLAAILTALQKMDDWALETNKLFGYSDRLFLNYVPTTTGGTLIYNSDAVPAGEIWVVEAISAHDATTNVRILFAPYDGATLGPALADLTPSAAGVRVMWSGNLTLKQGDMIRCYWVSTVSGDILSLVMWGHKMKVA